jgi:hypothetical protein
MKPKEALIKDGQIPTSMGRGRLSRVQDQRCRELASKGWDIEGYSRSSSPTAPVVKNKPVRNEKVIADFVIFWEEAEYKAMSGKTVHSMREVCNNCRVSLVQCHCGSPTILGNIPIRIVRK